MVIGINKMFHFTVRKVVTHGGVAVPEIHVDIGKGIASVSVDELDVHVYSNALLVIHDILTD
jgi:molybdopterin-binding protein